MNAADVPALTPEQATLVELMANGLPFEVAVAELDIPLADLNAWADDKRFCYLLQVAARPDNPDRPTELIVINHELVRARIAARWGRETANAWLSKRPDPPPDPGETLPAAASPEALPILARLLALAGVFAALARRLRS